VLVSSLTKLINGSN